MTTLWSFTWNNDGESADDGYYSTNKREIIHSAVAWLSEYVEESIADLIKEFPKSGNHNHNASYVEGTIKSLRNFSEIEATKILVREGVYKLEPKYACGTVVTIVELSPLKKG